MRPHIALQNKSRRVAFRDGLNQDATRFATMSFGPPAAISRDFLAIGGSAELAWTLLR
jgi:hypothetical protein